MGVKYFRVKPDVLNDAHRAIAAHENELVGPRARGYWFDRPDDYDYVGVRETARQLDQIGQANAIEQLELAEVQAHSLALLDVELPADGLEFPPALFLTSGDAATLRRYLKAAQRRLGTDPEAVAARIVNSERDPRFSAYLEKQLRHLRETVPVVWRLHQRAIDAGDSLLVVDLRARDLEIPEEFELFSVY